MTAKKGTAPARPPGKHDAEQVLERLRKLCLSIPGAIEKLSHGEPTWFAGAHGNVFAMFDNHHHGAPHVSVWIPTPFEIQEFLVASDGRAYFVPPYVGKKGWTGVVLDSGPDWKVVEDLLRNAFAGASKTSARPAARTSTAPPERASTPPASRRSTPPSRRSTPPSRRSTPPAARASTRPRAR